MNGSTNLKEKKNTKRVKDIAGVILKKVGKTEIKLQIVYFSFKKLRNVRIFEGNLLFTLPNMEK